MTRPGTDADDGLVDLLAVLLLAGEPTADAVALVADAAVTPASTAAWSRWARSLGAGLAPVVIDGDPPGSAAIVAALTRATSDGSSIAAGLLAAAEHRRTTQRLAVTARTRSAAVWSVLPLGLCLLPAFVLLGVVPLVASLLRGVIG